jgi:hypothetical protein
MRIRDDLLPAASYFAEACRASRAHSRLAASSLAIHGDHGADISGCVREHFPDEVKGMLRALAHDVTRASDKAYAMRPKGVHMATMRKLSRAIASAHGSGFYGPQP